MSFASTKMLIQNLPSQYFFKPSFFGRLVISILFMIIMLISSAQAAIDVYEFDSPQQEAQYRALIEELRCPKCQNQNLAGSDAQIAQDLKQKTYEMVKQGRTDTEIRQYMFDRYGDFISYKPPIRPSTWILWFFPPILLVVVLIGWFWQVKRKQKAASLTAHHTHPSYEDKIIHNTNDNPDTPHDGLTEEEQQRLNELLAKYGHDKQKSLAKNHDEIKPSGETK